MVRDKKSSEIMAEELHLSVETMLYSATDAKLQDVSSKSGLDVVGKKKRQLINHIRDELKKTCTPSGEEELDDTATSNATKYLKDLLAFLKDEPPPLEESSEEDEGSSETNGTSDEL